MAVGKLPQKPLLCALRSGRRDFNRRYRSTDGKCGNEGPYTWKGSLGGEGCEGKGEDEKEREGEKEEGGRREYIVGSGAPRVSGTLCGMRKSKKGFGVERKEAQAGMCLAQANLSTFRPIYHSLFLADEQLPKEPYDGASTGRRYLLGRGSCNASRTGATFPCRAVHARSAPPCRH